MKRIPALLVVVACAAWALTFPSVRSRVEAVRAKADGARPEVSWAQLLVSLAPTSWRPGIRAGLLGIVESLDAAAVAPGVWSRSLDLPAGPGEALTLHSLFLEPTACMRLLDVHLSILAAGQTPHPVHRHEEEELLVMLSGEADIVRGDPSQPESSTIAPVGPGSVVYHPADLPHTIRAGDDESARYLVFKWRAEKTPHPENALEAQHRDLSAAQQELVERDAEFGSEFLFESPTLYLKRLHTHVSRAKSGAGYPDERDPYDIAMVLISGALLSRGREVRAPAVLYYPADEPHDLSGVGPEAAEYLVVEFHGHAELDSP